MKKRLALLAFTLLVASCTQKEDPVSSTGERVLADAQYYPTLPETVWHYRVDSTGADKKLVRDAYRVNTRVTGGTFVNNDTVYAVQVNETVKPTGSTYDTLYIRKDDRGVFMSSPVLRGFSLLGQFPQLGQFLSGDFPKEFMILPLHPEYVTNWDILRFDLTGIPIIQVYFHVTAQYMGRENVTTSAGVYKDCAKVRISIDATFPNPADPTNILNPIRIRDNADFWMARPLGIVVGDGAESIFLLMNGRIPLSLTPSTKKLRMEVLDMSIAQPSGACATFK
jgi:hypothetical protein